MDVIALVGMLRYREHRSISEIHQQLKARQVMVCERTVEHLLHRYDELVTVHLQHKDRLRKRMNEQGRAILAMDGLQPDVGHARPRGHPRSPRLRKSCWRERY